MISNNIYNNLRHFDKDIIVQIENLNKTDPMYARRPQNPKHLNKKSRNFISVEIVSHCVIHLDS